MRLEVFVATSIPRRILLALTAATLCLLLTAPPGTAGPQPGEAARKPSGSLLDGYRLVVGPITLAEVPDDLSGVTFVPDTGTLLVVDNGTPRLSEYDRDGRFRRHITLVGFEDVEDVFYAGGGKLALIEERRRLLTEHDFSPETTVLTRDTVRTLLLDGEPSGNNGLEGVTLDPASERWIVVKEWKPRRILAIARNAPANEPSAARALWDVEKRNLGLEDLSGVCFDPRTGNLLLLSDESRLVVECTLDGKEVGRLSLAAGSAGLDHDVGQPEGIALDDQGRLYIANEPNSLYIFARP